MFEATITTPNPQLTGRRRAIRRIGIRWGILALLLLLLAIVAVTTTVVTAQEQEEGLGEAEYDAYDDQDQQPQQGEAQYDEAAEQQQDDYQVTDGESEYDDAGDDQEEEQQQVETGEAQYDGYDDQEEHQVEQGEGETEYDGYDDEVDQQEGEGEYAYDDAEDFDNGDTEQQQQQQQQQGEEQVEDNYDGGGDQEEEQQQVSEGDPQYDNGDQEEHQVEQGEGETEYDGYDDGVEQQEGGGQQGGGEDAYDDAEDFDNGDAEQQQQGEEQVEQVEENYDGDGDNTTSTQEQELETGEDAYDNVEDFDNGDAEQQQGEEQVEQVEDSYDVDGDNTTTTQEQETGEDEYDGAEDFADDEQQADEGGGDDGQWEEGSEGEVNVIEEPEQQKSQLETLEELYNETQGTAWFHKDNWFTTNNICNWFGVICDDSNVDGGPKIIELYLPNNNLVSRKLPRSVYRLPYLRRLTLKGNPIMDANFVNGFTSNSNLTLTWSPLESIDFENCLLSHLDGIEDAPLSLRELRLSKNHGFRGLSFPTRLLQLSQLEKLYFSSSNLGGRLPGTDGFENDGNYDENNQLGFDKMSSLRVLKLNSNYMTGSLPSDIGKALSKIELLHLGRNTFEGTLPFSLNYLTKIRELNLEGRSEESEGEEEEEHYSDYKRTKLSGKLLRFYKASQLSTIILSNQAFTGSIPDGFLVNDRDVDENNIEATSHNDELVTIDLRNNKLTGTLSAGWDRFPRLDLDITGNMLSGSDNGEVPSSYCTQSSWMNGLVAKYGCSAIACPAGSYNKYGKQISDEDKCDPCPNQSLGAYLGLTSCISADAPPPPTAVVLAELYHTTGGDNWHNNDGWSEVLQPVIDKYSHDGNFDLKSSDVEADLIGIDYCTNSKFFGVTCNDEGEVAILSLSTNNLEGTLPSSILFQLPTLASLDLSYNHIELESGDGFAALEHAKSLTRLDLSNTLLSKFDGISKAPHHLTELNLSGNYFDATLPDELFTLSHLKELNLHSSVLKGTISPAGIRQLTSLQRLYLHENKLSGELPSELAYLTSLEEVDLSDNEFIGSLPEEWNAGMTHIKKLLIRNGGGNFSGGLIPFTSLERVEELDLSSNGFIGTIPSDFLSAVVARSGTNNIKVLLSNNQITGSIPTSLGHLSRLFIGLENNQISDLPEELCENRDWMDGEVGLVPDRCNAILCPPGSYSGLGRASVRMNVMCTKCEVQANVAAADNTNDGNENNKFFGSTSCGGDGGSEDSGSSAKSNNLEREILDKLYYATLGPITWRKAHTNWTKPEVPICFREGVRCSKYVEGDDNGVIEIYLNEYGLKGKIPSEVFDLPHIRSLGFGFNDVDISFDNIGKATRLEILLISGTNIKSLEGIENAGPKFNLLRYARNRIRGSFPSELLYVSSLKSLSLNDNMFSSTIPVELGVHLTNLEELFLQGSRFVGFLPTELALLTQLNTLHVERNRLSGLLPTELNSLLALKEIDLSQQSSLKGFSGPLTSFENSPDLRLVDLSQNNLAGTIPSSFLKSVDNDAKIMVNVSSNALFGGIPTSLEHLQQLNIDLSQNRISSIPPQLCDMDGWMNGVVGLLPQEHRCSGILCPPGTFAPVTGRQMQATRPCRDCENGGKEAAPYYGSVVCIDTNSTAEGDDDSICATYGACSDDEPPVDVDMSERKVLELLFSSLQGGGWTSKTNWMTDSPICSWNGILCNYDDFDENDEHQGDEGIVAIDLESNNLKGYLPPHVIWGMPYLRTLNLKGNADLEVSFHHGAYGRDSDVERLLLSGCQVKSLDGLHRLPNLRELSVSGLKGPFPSNVLALRDIETLDLSDNFFVGTLPLGLRLLEKLRSFVVTNNDFHGTIPKSLFELKHLEEIVLDENLLSGTLPDLIVSTMPSLKTLSIARSTKSGRSLIGKLPTFDKTPNLEKLILNGNELTGSIATMFGAVSDRLDLVDLQSNALTGPIPSGLADKPIDLNILLSDNQITEVPQNLCEQDSWMDGAVGEIQMSCDAILCRPFFRSNSGRATVGEIGDQCIECPYLGKIQYPPFFGMTECDPPLNARGILLDLYDECDGTNWIRNDFWGTAVDVCSWFGIGCDNKGNIILLNLQSNNLNGTFMDAMFNLPHLEVLRLSSNPNLTFKFVNIGSAKRLRELHVDGTGLTNLHGAQHAKSLTVLDASFNNLRGTLATKSHLLFELTNLRVLSLRNNNLDGLLPSTDVWALLKYLRVLRLDNNGFTGPLPSFEKSASLTGVFLGNNKLNGQIPHNLLEKAPIHTAPVTVDLSDNEIVGTVPEELSRIPRLSLYIRNNKIVKLPQSLCANPLWMNGDVENYGCSAIACPPQTVNTIGRMNGQHTEGECMPCPKGSDLYYGQSVCPSDDTSAAAGGLKSMKSLCLAMASMLISTVLLHSMG